MSCTSSFQIPISTSITIQLHITCILDKPNPFHSKTHRKKLFKNFHLKNTRMKKTKKRNCFNFPKLHSKVNDPLLKSGLKMKIPIPQSRTKDRNKIKGRELEKNQLKLEWNDKVLLETDKTKTKKCDWKKNPFTCISE